MKKTTNNQNVDLPDISRDWLSEYIDCIVYINLDERFDRNTKCKQSLDSVGIYPYYRVPAIKDTIGIRGCTLSHYNIIKHAKDCKYKNILIFEDDFIIVDTTTFKSNLISTLQQIAENNQSPDMLYLGGNLETGYNETHSKIDDNLFRITGAKTTHSYIVYESMYDTILDKYDNVNINDVGIWSGPNRVNIDFYYLSEIHHNPDYTILGCYPCLTDQAPGWSDIEQSNVNYALANTWNSLLRPYND